MSSPMTRVNSLVSADIGNYLTNVQTWGGIIYNVKAYGAIGDGTTDDTAAVNSAIAACPDGGTVFFPIPTVGYRITSTIVIDKVIKLVGAGVSAFEEENGLEKLSQLLFSTSVTIGLRIVRYGVHIESLTVKMENFTNTIVAGIYLDQQTNNFVMRNIVLKDLNVYIASGFGHCVKGEGVITSTFENIRTVQGAYGFYFDTPTANGTSLEFIRTWATSSVVGGYYFDDYYYISLTNTASDSVNGPDYPYTFKNCKAVSMQGCGAELADISSILFDNTDGASIDGGFCFSMNMGATALGTFSELRNGSKNIVFSGCNEIDTAGSVANIYIDATSHAPAIINCSFNRGYNDNGTIVTLPVFGNSGGYMQIGRTQILDNPLGSLLSVFGGGRSYAIRGQKFGIINTGLTQYLSYFESDGALVVVSVASIASLPTANEANRGKIYRVQESAGVADGIYICLKSAADTYSWKAMATG